MTRKKKVIFMLQNGIGFGHFKLALTISNYLKKKHHFDALFGR